MEKPKILVQLDSDLHASPFDSVVAIDAGVDQLLPCHAVRPGQVRGLVHDAMFPRTESLDRTAIFIGGSDVAAGEELLQQVIGSFFGPIRVSVMMDANGANTTAAAAVVAVSRHVDLAQTNCLVLAATGPVGQRVVRLLAREKAQVRVASRKMDRAERVCQEIQARVAEAQLTAVQTGELEDLKAAIDGVDVVVAAGQASVMLLPEAVRSRCQSLQVVIDLNAVPPLGVEGVEVTARQEEQHGAICYGAIGVGGTKMKIHLEAIRKLFTTNDLVLDAEEVFAIGQDLEADAG
ncbi:MAG: methylene-tetrahydromethanopterin dehydrogenase N-terminal domain-containing protein [Pirellulaceae bacterium]